MVSSSDLLQIVNSQLREKCQMSKSSAQPLLLAETFLVLEISLLRSSLKEREFIAMKYVVLWLFMKTAHVTALVSWSQRMWLDFKRKGLDDFIIANNCSHQDKDSLSTFPVQKCRGNQKGMFPCDFLRCLLRVGRFRHRAVPEAGCEAAWAWGGV